MRINNNLMAMNTHRQLGLNSNAGAKSIEKLSSGYRINRAGDDAAGLAISEKMRAQIRGLNQASRNAQDGISLVQTAEGALNETQAILQRMRELAVQSSNDTNVDADRSALQNEVDQLATELTRISNNTEFNERKLLDGGLQSSNIGELTFHIGANQGQKVELGIGALDAETLGVAADSISGTGAGQVSNVEIDRNNNGTNVVDGAVITLNAADNTGVAANGTLDVNGNNVTGTFASVGTAANGITITFAADSDAAATATYNTTTRTVTVSANWDNSGGTNTAPANLAALETLVQGAHASLTSVSLSEDGTYAAADFDGAGSITLANGSAANTAETIITISDGTNTATQTVNDSDTSITLTASGFEGVSFDVTNATTLSNASDTITVGTTVAAAATFASGERTAAAVTDAGINISTQAAADSAITTINTALTKVSDERAKLGAVQNRLEHTIKNLDTSSENLQASESRIRDVDMAKEMMNFTKNNILQQAAQAMLAQANQAPQGVLQLLR